MKWNNETALTYLLYLYVYKNLNAWNEAGYWNECNRVSIRLHQMTGENCTGNAVDAAYRKFKLLFNDEQNFHHNRFGAPNAMIDFYESISNNLHGEREWNNEEDLRYLMNSLNINPNDFP